MVVLQPLQGGEFSQTLWGQQRGRLSLQMRCLEERHSGYVPRPHTCLQDNVIEADEVLWTGAPLILIPLRLLQLGLQCVRHALVPLHQRAQLDVAQVAGR